MNVLIDTLLNIGVFIFIGLMIWLYLKDDEAGGNKDWTSLVIRKQSLWQFIIACILFGVEVDNGEVSRTLL